MKPHLTRPFPTDRGGDAPGRGGYAVGRSRIIRNRCFGPCPGLWHFWAKWAERVALSRRHKNRSSEREPSWLRDADYLLPTGHTGIKLKRTELMFPHQPDADPVAYDGGKQAPTSFLPIRLRLKFFENWRTRCENRKAVSRSSTASGICATTKRSQSMAS